MFEFLTYSAEKIEILLLVAFRAAGLFAAAPVIGHKTIPPTIKAGLSILLGILLVPMAAQSNFQAVDSIWLLAIFAAKEMLVGVIIGMFFNLLFYGVRMAGSIIGFQSGLIMANVFDPNYGDQTSIVSEFTYAVALLVFLAIDGHHAAISAFADSYRIVPVGLFSFGGSAADMIIRYSGYAFVMAVKLSAPVMMTLFMVSVALGVIARTVPQMNIFIVGIPLKIGVGFLVMAMALPMFRVVIDKSLFYLDNQVLPMLHAIGQV